MEFIHNHSLHFAIAQLGKLLFLLGQIGRNHLIVGELMVPLE